MSWGAADRELSGLSDIDDGEHIVRGDRDDVGRSWDDAGDRDDARNIGDFDEHRDGDRRLHVPRLR